MKLIPNMRVEVMFTSIDQVIALGGCVGYFGTSNPLYVFAEAKPEHLKIIMGHPDVAVMGEPEVVPFY